MNWLKHCVAALVVVLFWVSTSLPANANFIKDGGFINDMETMMEGKPGSELAIKVINENMLDWVTLGKDYCNLREEGLDADAITTVEQLAIPADASPEVNQSMTLALKTMARVAKMTYCPDVS